MIKFIKKYFYEIGYSLICILWVFTTVGVTIKLITGDAAPNQFLIVALGWIIIGVVAFVFRDVQAMVLEFFIRLLAGKQPRSEEDYKWLEFGIDERKPNS